MVSLDPATRVVVIGGGPAGTLFAIQLHLMLRAQRRTVRSVTIVERKGEFTDFGRRGCNLCAGVLTSSLVHKLERLGIVLSGFPGLIQRRLSGYLLSTPRGTLDLPNLSVASRIYSVNRGRGPDHRTTRHARSFDASLLAHARALGAAEVLKGAVCGLERLPRDGGWELRLDEGERVLRAEFLVVACGVNTKLFPALERVEPTFRAPLVARGMQAELPMTARGVTELLRNRAVVVTSTRFPRLRMIALTPKCRHLTLTAIGADSTYRCDRSQLRRIIELLQARELLPPRGHSPAPACMCEPSFPIWPARHPYSERLVIIGDASGFCRFLKNGIESALETARLAAETAVQRGIDRRSLREGYYRRALRIHRDNRYGRLVERFYRFVLHVPHMERALLDNAMREPPHGSRFTAPIRWSLWNLFSGVAPYREIWRHFLSPGVQLSLLRRTVWLLLRW
jgi:flavin-dependent dehydrogenase